MYSKSIENSPGIDFNAPALRRHRSLRFLKDYLARWGVAIGGMGVIVAILLIFIYLLYEVVPLFKGASIEPFATYERRVDSESPPLYLAMEEQVEIAIQVERSGEILFSSTNTGETVKQVTMPIPGDVSVTSISENTSGTGLMAAGLSNGQVLLFKHEYKITWPDDKRVITPVISYPYGNMPLSLFDGTSGISRISISNSDEKLLIAAEVDGQLLMSAFTKEEDFLTEEVTLEQRDVLLPLVSGRISHMLLDPEQSWLYVAVQPDRLVMVNIADLDSAYIHSETDLTQNSASITDLEFLLGGVSLLAGDSDGNIGQWFLVNEDDQKVLKQIREFKLGLNAVTSIISEHRRKGFLAADDQGNVGVFYTTAGRTLLIEKMTEGPIDQIAIAPRGNYLMVTSGSSVILNSVENEHPEISVSALWGEIWYESYNQPEYIWQSSAANNDFEPKMSLMPLAFGTLKAAFYAMLLAAPLAICGAIYTAYFMAPGMRRKVKPIIELMEALPTVILGFLAGLWLAPLIESNLTGIFALMLFVPVGILLFAFTWDNLPGRIRHAIPEGWQASLLIPVVLLSGGLAMMMNGTLEDFFFDGDMRVWITSELGIAYDQRNALVVGLAMGFAVIPTIFSIAEDAIFSVPKHLSYGSLALGATPWQTLTRVVLLTASPGIFSALMIGMGRAVGETMIVLMATGNTPIMDANIFEGMRTLAANIAVEMPESEVDSSHYRVLFLAALVLFLFTFVVNTAAEIVRHRLRKKYSSL